MRNITGFVGLCNTYETIKIGLDETLVLSNRLMTKSFACQMISIVHLTERVHICTWCIRASTNHEHQIFRCNWICIVYI